jgi:prophage DNA circulation protein
MITIANVREAAAIVTLAADMLLVTSTEQKGRSGSDLRRACGDLKANAKVYIVENLIADKLFNAFEVARLAGASMDDFNRIREAVVQMASLSLVARLIKQGCVCFCLQQISLVLITIKFTSRDDVDRVRRDLHPAFDQSEEAAADDMILEVYRTLITLHAAVTFHLYETARPLPQMLDFKFAASRPTLIQSHRLYSDAGRADELRQENKVVHPAFAPRQGRALAS